MLRILGAPPGRPFPVPLLQVMGEDFTLRDLAGYETVIPLSRRSCTAGPAAHRSA